MDTVAYTAAMPEQHWFDALYDRLHDEGQDPRILPCGTGRILAARHGARLLAIDLGLGDVENLLFTASGADGKMTGGDRLWIAPEAAYFWPSLEDARERPKQTATCPASIDPGAWETMGALPATLGLRTAIKLEDRRSGKTAAISAMRTFAAVTLPASLAHADSGVRGCAFTIENTLVETGGDAGVLAGAWDLAQLPPTGTLICPTVGGTAKVNSYYDPFGEHHVQVDDQAVRFTIDGRRRIKMGLAAAATSGRMGYYRPMEAGRSSLLLRVFTVLPGEPYADLPRDHPAHDAAAQNDSHPETLSGDVLQAYNDDGEAFGRSVGSDITFGEMEHHGPCLITGQEPKSRTEVSTTYALAGPDEVIQALGQAVLGVPVIG